MSTNESTICFENQPIQNIFNQYQIQLNYYLDKIYFKIQNNYNIYESNFNLEYLQNYQLLNSKYTMKEMIEFINELVDQKNIKIEKNENNLKLILISKLPNQPNVELILNKKILYQIN